MTDLHLQIWIVWGKGLCLSIEPQRFLRISHFFYAMTKLDDNGPVCRCEFEMGSIASGSGVPSLGVTMLVALRLEMLGLNSRWQPILHRRTDEALF